MIFWSGGTRTDPLRRLRNRPGRFIHLQLLCEETELRDTLILAVVASNGYVQDGALWGTATSATRKDYD